jgi:hypothetical protein
MIADADETFKKRNKGRRATREKKASERQSEMTV